MFRRGALIKPLFIHVLMVGLLLGACARVPVTALPAPTPRAAVTSTTVPSPIPTRTSPPATVAVSVTPTETPNETPTRPLALAFTTQPCPAGETIQQLSTAQTGRLLIVGGDVGSPNYGLYALTAGIQPQLLIPESNLIAKTVLTPDGRWIVYSTLCPDLATCEYPTEPREWVIVSTDTLEVHRLEWVGTSGAYEWILGPGPSPEIQVIPMPGPQSSSLLKNPTAIRLPSGQMHALTLSVDLPDLETIGGVLGQPVAIDPGWNYALYYQFDFSRNLRGLALRSIANNTTVYSVADTEHIVGSGFGVNWAWTEDGAQVAFTLAAERADPPTQPSGDIFVLAPGDPAAQQITNFAAAVAEPYFASPRVWSPGGDHLLIDLGTYSRSRSGDLYVADLQRRLLTGICVDHASNAVWAPSGNQVALLRFGSDNRGSLSIVDSDTLQRFSLDTPLRISDLIGWLP